jgi:uncharacterized membrane protein
VQDKTQSWLIGIGFVLLIVILGLMIIATAAVLLGKG